MSYKVIERLIPTLKNSIKSPYNMSPSFITVHNTANDASASNEISYMTNNSNQVSFHVAIDDVEAIIGIPFNRNAWHCGDGSGTKSGNRTSIGIEICYSKSGGERYKKAEENAIDYIAKLLKQFGWGIDRVKYHWDWARPSDGYRKNCPHRIIQEKRKDSFKKAIANRLEELNATTKPSVSIPRSTKKELIINFSSPALQDETEFSLQSKARREIIVNTAVEGGANKIWLEKLNNNTITDGDLLGLCMKHIVDNNK